MLLVYVAYAFGVGYALRASADIAPTSRPAIQWGRRLILAAMFPVFLAAAVVMAAKAGLERQSPRGDSPQTTPHER